MKFESRANQKNNFPKKSEPDIFFHTKGSYKSFGIQSLYKDLFVSVKSYADSALITFPEGHKEKKGEELLAFLMPEELFRYIKERAKQNDYKEFIVDIHKSNKIALFVQEMFHGDNEKYSKKMFAECFRRHFVDLLKNAIFSQFLRSELESIAKVITPESISEPAHGKFIKLLNGGHKYISIAIANIFASAMLGLFSMEYAVPITARNKRGIQNAKTYLLNDLGMRYIWVPESVTTSFEELFNVQSSFDHGDFAAAYRSVENWLKRHEQNAPMKELAKAYQLKGLTLCKLAKSKERGFEGQVGNGIKLLKKSISTGAAEPYVYWFLYKHYEEEGSETAVKYLKTAFAQKYAKAVVEVAFLYLNEKTRIKDISYEEILAKIEHIISHESANETTDIGKCYYLRGKFARKNGDESEAQKDFEIAARKGNERAKQELIQKERVAERGIFPSFSNQPKAKCCFANTLTGTNYQVISTFPNDEWALFSPVKTAVNGIQFARNIDEFINLQHIGEFEFCRPQIVFLFMSEDKEKNLNECLELLDKLFNAVIELSDKQKWELIDNTYIYVSAKYETASMLIDANTSQMGNGIYFKVHIADENRDTVHKLLCDVPLFLPALNGAKSENSTKVILFGSSEMNYCFVKESIASAYLGAIHPIDITLLGENADVLESRFQQECPGVFGCPDITCIRPKFIRCSIKETDFPKLISGQLQINPSDNKAVHRKEPDDDIAEALKYGNYFIVDYADDLENIRFAMELRTWLLRSRDTFDRTPFIGVKVSEKQNSYLTSHLTLAGQAAGDSYYNKYDLFPFGISAQTYHYKNIIEDSVLNRIALQIHKFYYLDNDLDKKDEKKLKEALEECKRSAENDFYRFSYNADSSISTAIGLCYRFFAAKCILASKEDYLDFGALKSLEVLSEFSDQLNSNSKEELAKIEQSRWNSFMLIRGWLPADINQVKAYEAQSSGSAHKHVLAKLHPFIREWDDLDDPNLEKVLGILKLKSNYNKKPQVTTRRSIADTTRFFITDSKEHEQTH